jgi:hypothetical protein
MRDKKSQDYRRGRVSASAQYPTVIRSDFPPVTCPSTGLILSKETRRESAVS